MLGFGVGLRPCEQFALRANDVKEGELTIAEDIVEGHLGETKTPASNTTVVLTPELEGELRDYIREHHLQSDDFLFTYATGKPMSQNNYVQRQLKTIGRKIGVPDLDVRMMRTAYASYAAPFGDTPKDLQRALRHETATFSVKVYQKAIPKTTRRMQHNYESDLREAAFGTIGK
jgi:integrase